MYSTTYIGNVFEKNLRRLLLNKEIKELYCISCGEKYPIGEYYKGCPSCYEKGHPSSLSIAYKNKFVINAEKKGLSRYESHLPFLESEIVSLGEGKTSLVSLEVLASKLGLKKLYSKNEFQNPSGSHKDRMNSFFIPRVIDANYDNVAAASSGNQGVSLALYAAAAKINCLIVATKSINPFWKMAIESTGAEIVYTETFMERWEYIKKRIQEGNVITSTNVIDPPIGSNPFGVQGYKVISYELYEEMTDGLADYILVPNSRGDLIWGIYEGFVDLRDGGYISKIPKLIAVEPFPRLGKVENIEDCVNHYDGDYSQTPSIGGDTVTVQSYLAVKNSGGYSISVDKERVLEAISIMSENGLYLEDSSAVSICCLDELVKLGLIKEGSNVVMISTSHGFKNEVRG